MPGQICMELPEVRKTEFFTPVDEQTDLTPLMRMIAGKADKILTVLEQLHEDIAKMDDHMCQVMRRLVG